MLYVTELGGAYVLEGFQVFGCLFFEELFGQRGQFALYHIAFAVGHAAFGKLAEHLGHLLLSFCASEGHQLVHGILDEVAVVDVDIEVEWQVEVVGEGADDAVHEAVDGADCQVGVVVEDGRADGGGVVAQGGVVELELVSDFFAHIVMNPQFDDVV